MTIYSTETKWVTYSGVAGITIDVPAVVTADQGLIYVGYDFWLRTVKAKRTIQSVVWSIRNESNAELVRIVMTNESVGPGPTDPWTLHKSTSGFWINTIFARGQTFSASVAVHYQSGSVYDYDVKHLSFGIPYRPYYLPAAPVLGPIVKNSYSHFTLNWETSSWEGAPAIDHHILRRDDLNSTWGAIDVVRDQPSVRSYQDYTVKPNRLYEYVVVAGNPSGTGEWSNAQSLRNAMGPKVMHTDGLFHDTIPYVCKGNDVWVEAVPWYRGNQSWTMYDG